MLDINYLASYVNWLSAKKYKQNDSIDMLNYALSLHCMFHSKIMPEHFYTHNSHQGVRDRWTINLNL